MKKNKVLILLPIIVFVVLLILFIVDYTHIYDLVIKVNLVDEKSPDRILKVYDNNKEIKFKRIEYSDGVYLCNYDVPAVSYVDIKDEKELVVVVKYNKKITAKLVFDN